MVSTKISECPRFVAYAETLLGYGCGYGHIFSATNWIQCEV